MGVLIKEKPFGKIVDGWATILSENNFEQIDVTKAVSTLLAPKDSDEFDYLRNAATASTIAMSETFVDELSTIIDEEQRITHAKLSEKIEAKIDSSKFLKSKEVKLDTAFDLSQLEWCYAPIVQSGGQFDLKPSAVSDDRQLHSGVIYASLGLRYHSYCSNIGRTFLINPTDTQQKNYEFVQQLQRNVISFLKAGVVCSDAYAHALAYVKNKRPELAANFINNIGYAIGIDFRDGTFAMNPKNNNKLVEDMTLCLVIGFTDIENPKAQSKLDKKYSLCLIDTARVEKEGSKPLTSSPRSLEDISFWLKDEESAEESSSEAGSTIAASTMKRHTRQEAKTRQVDDSAEQKRREHQKQLAIERQEAGLKRFQGTEAGTNGESTTVVKKFESYRRDTQLPAEIRDLQIIVDRRAQSVLLPICGAPVPFHINTMKSISRNDEGDFIFLRFNFITPGQGGGRKEELPEGEQNASFVRSLTFKSRDTDRFSQLYAVIQDMKKNAVKREAEQKELADVVQQEDLVEVKSKRPLMLTDVFCRPALDGKRVPGMLEIHQNGLRYQSPLRQDHRIDVPFSNIRQIFFQPCDHELIVLIHIHLKNPIMIGKKKSYDLQVYKEASDIQFDETGNRRRRARYGDEDELEQEQEERRRRAQLNKDFHTFSEKIADASDGKVDVDVPFRELGFTGVPFRSNVLLQPTTDCLVQLIDLPFTVVFLTEIELAHLERVQFGLKNFDMVLVFKDFKRPPVHINTIPVSYLEGVKDWLDSVDIPYTEGPLNLNWQTIMKTINDDPRAFFEDGGWGFLASDSESEEQESDEEASEFEAASAEEEESSEEDDESDYDDEESSEEEPEDDEDDNGEDWDELDRKARREDAKRSDERHKKRR